MKKAAVALLGAGLVFLMGCEPLMVSHSETTPPAATAKPSATAAKLATTAQISTSTPEQTALRTATAAASPAPSATSGSGAELYQVRCDTPPTLYNGTLPTSKALGKLTNGENVQVDQFEGAFAHVSEINGKRTGYVLSGYLVSMERDPFLAGLEIVKVSEQYTYGQMMTDLKKLAARYPAKLRLESAGKSLEGRDIAVALLGNPNAAHHVLVQCSIHARENMATLLVMAQLEYCLKYGDAAYGSSTVGQWLNDVCIHVLPMTNPDGVTISQQAMMTSKLEQIYKQDIKHKYTNLSPADYLKAWKANAAGVDINRNFPSGWLTLDSRATPSSSNYKGALPTNQPETRALADYTVRYAFDATISYHATGGRLYWQYGSNKQVNSKSYDLALAVRACTQYQLQDSTDKLDAGGYKDWVMDSLGIPSLTIEIGSRDCPLPLDEFDTIWQRNRNVLAAVARWVKEK